MTSMRRLYPELEAMESVYASRDLDVCCVRPTSLTDGPRTGRGVVATRLVGSGEHLSSRRRLLDVRRGRGRPLRALWTDTH